jgi:hypothetical protein
MLCFFTKTIDFIKDQELESRCTFSTNGAVASHLFDDFSNDVAIVVTYIGRVHLYVVCR